MEEGGGGIGSKASARSGVVPNRKNTLYFGDNLKVLREKIRDESIDLVYLDPPFNSKADYNVLFKTPENVDSPSQIIAFEDTWHWTNESESAYGHLLKADPKIASVIRGLREAIGENDMMAYLVMMAVRLIELHRVLKPTGSLYLHCDPTASHYLKIILDAVFDPRNFQNEIIWKRTGSHNSSKRWGPIHDVLFYYSKSKTKTWNRILQPYTKEYLDAAYRYNDKFGRYRLTELTGSGTRAGESGQSWKGVNFTERGRHWALPPTRSLPDWFVYPESWSKMSVQERLDTLDEQNLIDWGKDGNSLPRFKRYLLPSSGLPLQDMIVDILPVSGGEDMGYDTQKPVELLERIIRASSDEGDLILDPFCGCGTAIEAAQKLNRRWVGIDITHLAIGLIEKRMRDAFDITIRVDGTPTSFESAEELARRDKFQFETWAVGLIPNVLPNKKQVGDRGVDGRVYIQLGKDDKGKRIDAKIIVSVKGGDNLTPSMIRDLEGTMDSEKAELGVFVCLRTPTRKMKEAAARAGMFETPLGESYPKLQIHTVSDHFNGIRTNLPSLADFVRAPRADTTNSGRQTVLK